MALGKKGKGGEKKAKERERKERGKQRVSWKDDDDKQRLRAYYSESHFGGLIIEMTECNCIAQPHMKETQRLLETDSRKNTLSAVSFCLSISFQSHTKCTI
jgi:hypothetical protein